MFTSHTFRDGKVQDHGGRRLHVGEARRLFKCVLAEEEEGVLWGFVVVVDDDEMGAERLWMGTCICRSECIEVKRQLLEINFLP